MFHLVTEWSLPYPIEEVWSALSDFQSWPAWWPAWKKLDKRDPGAEMRVGTVFDCELKGSLPYSMRFAIEVTTLERPYLNEHRSSGGLVGTGKWILKPEGQSTRIEHHWDVGSTNPFLNLFAGTPFARRMMEKNHAEVMASGYQGLKAVLEKAARAPA